MPPAVFDDTYLAIPIIEKLNEMILEIITQILIFYAVFLLVLWIPLRDDMAKFWGVAKVAVMITAVMIGLYILARNLL